MVGKLFMILMVGLTDFRGIIPTEVFKVEKDYSAVRLSERVVKTEVRGAQRAIGGSELQSPAADLVLPRCGRLQPPSAS